MTFQELLNKLNEGQSLVSLAKELKMELRTLENKLLTRAIVFNEEVDCWEYCGNNATSSLQTDVTKKTVVLKQDKEFVEKHRQVKFTKSDVSEEALSKEFQLYADYKSTDSKLLKKKKTISVDEQQFLALKAYCDQNGFKFNQFLTTLLKTSIKYYEINIQQN